ncbi:hypothetical protein KVR01_013681 [Diaporthe batatas]|uniref:uncharacterized protein n=1 Tax=Diaporthe batatas TaxID=748121 RepID=UPI001D044E91|nr:uncharacterized protein KVR01_013681 [Diaporthe batatas]KAG8156447.1 hypothetical protein KVR01_013681 [Diaporthe batatas]
MENYENIAAQAAQACAISVDDIEYVHRVSPIQEGLWAASTPEHAAYTYELVIEGKADAGNKFKAAWQDLVDVTPMLRSCMLVLGPSCHLFQVVLRATSPCAGRIYSPDDSPMHLGQLDHTGLAQLYFSNSSSSAEEHTFQAVLKIHHALFDGWAMRLVLDKLRKAYRGEALAGPPKFQQFIDYIYALNRDSEKTGAASDFWRSRMADCRAADIVDRIPGLNAMTDSTTTFGSPQTFQSTTGSFTLSVMAYAAWGILAGAYAATDNVLFATMLSGRDVPVEGALDMAGPTMAAVPFHIRAGRDQSVAAVLDQIKGDLHIAVANQHVGLARICRDYGGFPSSQLQTMLLCQPAHLDVVGLQSDAGLGSPDWKVTGHGGEAHPYALVVECWLPRDCGPLRLTAYHDSRLLSSSQAEMLLRQLSELTYKIQSCVDEPAGSRSLVGDICLSSSGDVQALARFNAERPPPVDRCIHDLFMETTKVHSNSIAVDAWDEKFSYSRLDELSDRLAQSLTRLGVGPEKTVLVFFPKSAWVVVAMLAILKAGGAFVPVDPAQPDGRIKDMARISTCQIAISHPSLTARLEKVIGSQCIMLEISHAALAAVEPPPALLTSSHIAASPSSLAYILFTSGTTGVPKGVAVEHRAVASSITCRSCPDAMNMTSSSRVLQFSSYCFDAFIDEVFMTLTRGACICVPHTDELLGGLADAIDRYKITWSMITPSVARVLNPKRTPTLQTLILIGEAAVTADIEQWRGHVPQLRNGYGPTETCVICVVGDYFSERRYTAGTSLLGTPRGCLAWVVDPTNPNRLTPIGAAGELLIEGPNLGRGYWGDAAGTAASWISGLDWPGGLGHERRLYRTGDLVRMRPNGSLIYMGRIGGDSQAKLRGQRFELLEVEQNVRHVLPSIQQVTAVVFTPSETGLEEKRLAVLFVNHVRYKSTIRADQDVNTKDVAWGEVLPEQLQQELLEARRLLETNLPSYMIPSHWIHMQEMPRTVSGKADRKTMTRWLQSLTPQQLGFFLLDRASRAPRAAASCKEEALVKLWTKVLGIKEDEISVDADFIFLGGDSIKAMRLAAASRSHGITGLSTTAILQFGTIEALAKEIRLRGVDRPSGEAEDPLPAPFSLLRLVGQSAADAVIDAARACQVAPSAIQDLYPVTPFQKSLFTASLNSTNAYRGLFVYKLRHDVNVQRLQDAWSALASATPIIRTRLYTTPAGFFQAVVQNAVTCNVVSSSLDDHLFMEREASRAITFGSPLYRASILQDVREGWLQSYFVLNAHHAVYDAWSLSGLTHQLKTLYNNRPQEHDQTHPSANQYVRFVDHVLRAERSLAQSFWREYLTGDPFTQFPHTKVSPSQWLPTTDATTEHAFSFRGRHTRASVALYAAWSQLAAIYGGTDDVVFGIVTTGRDIPTLPHSVDIVGPMAATVPLRIHVPTGRDTPVSALFDEVQKAIAEVTPYEHCGMNEIRKASAAAAAACGFHSLLVVQATSTVLGKHERVDDPVVSERDAGANIHPYPLVLEATVRENMGDVNVVAHYDSTLLDGATVQRLLEQLGHLVQEMVWLAGSCGTLGQVDLLSPSDRASIWGWNSEPMVVVPVQRRVHDIIAEQTLLRPDKTAVFAWDKELTYTDLERLSSALAGVLSGRGVKTGQFVPICHEMSAWSVVAQVAVLKAGAACVSLDPSYPEARNAEIVAQCDASVGIVSSTTEPLFSKSSLTLLVAEFHSQSPSPPPATSLVPDQPGEVATPVSPAYCVFTSGSTGKPKGIIIEHAALCTSAQHYGAAMRLCPTSRVLQFASCAFDVSVGETLTTLMHGGTVCVAREDDRLADLAGCITRLQVNWLYLTSAVASMLQPSDVPRLETLVVGGEAVHQQVVETWAESHVTLINAYGPAETTIYCSARIVSTKDTDARDIGTALGCRMWIGWAPGQDDSNLRLAPLGATGELLIEGPIVARGYLGLPDLNATKFVGMPWLRPDRKVYRTGDLASQDAQGHFHFRGRRDNGLVKINGQRLDLGEVTTVLASSRGDIRQAAAVTFQRQGVADSPPSHPAVRLAAFIVLSDTASALGSVNITRLSPLAMTHGLRERILDIKKHLQTLLPKHMIPSVFVPVSALPKTRTLKIDLKAMAKMMETMTEADLQSLSLSLRADISEGTAYKAPRNAMESTILQHWTKALGLCEKTTPAGVDDNFFELGGDSITAMHFTWLARGDGLHLSVRDIYAHPSVSDLAGLLATRCPEGSPEQKADDPPLPFSLVSAGEKEAVLSEVRELGLGATDVEDIYAATVTQRGLLLETETSKDLWVSKDVFEFEADVDPERLRVAWERLVELNPIFRTRIVHAAAVGGVAQAYQVVLRPGKVWGDGSQAEECRFGFGHPLSYQRIQSNRFEWIRHHSLYDGWATNLVLHQFEHLYRTGGPDKRLVLPPSCYIRMLQRHDAETAKTFWQTEFSNISTGALESCAFPRTLSSKTSDLTPSTANRSTTRPVISLPGAGATVARLPVLVEAAWALTLSAYLNSEDVVLGVVRSGRTMDPSLAHIVCPTASFVPRRFQPNDGKEVSAFLEEASEKSEAATPHEHAGLAWLQETVQNQTRKKATLNHLVVVQTEELISGTATAGGQTCLEAIGLKPAVPSGGDAGSEPASPFPFGLVLELVVVKSKGSRSTQIQLLAYYDNRQISEVVLHRVLSHFEHILTQLIEAPRGTLLRDIGIWSSQLLRDQMPFVDAAPPPPPVEMCVHELIGQHWGQDSPQAHAPAVCTAQNNTILTYRDLDTCSALLCHRLLHDGRLVKQQSSFVGVLFNKSPWTVVAMLAIWRASAAVVLLDATQPRSHILKILNKANVEILLVTPETRQIVQDHPAVLIVDHESLFTPVPDEDVVNKGPRKPSKFGDPCYCIMTSGSTGEPKGVVVSHSGIAASAVHHGRATGLSTSSRVIQSSSYSFDVAIDEIISTLVHGGCVCVPREGDAQARLAEAISELDANVVLLTPGVLETLDRAAVPSLKTVVVGGSSLSASLRNAWQGRVRLLVAYGPSECSVTASMDTDISGKPLNTIGTPVGCRAWVLGYTGNEDGDANHRLRLAPLGNVGELAIEGPILALGYLGDAALTSEKFISASHISGRFCEFTGCPPDTRLYRTGDLVRQDSAGSLLFVGRRDNQVKVRGVRVEVEAVQQAILQSPAAANTVGDAVVTVPGKGHLQGRLVAVLQLRHETTTSTSEPAGGMIIGESPESEAIKRYLSKQLPSCHVPEVWASVTRMPQLPSSKVDRAAIRQQLEAIRHIPRTFTGVKAKFRSKTSSQKILRDLMGQILREDLSSAPGDLTFPQLGGNSLLAMQLVRRCKAVGAPLSLSHVLGNHTIEEMAREMNESRVTKLETHQQLVHGVQAWDIVPLTPAQHMFFSIYPWGPNYFNQSTYLRVNSAAVAVEQLQGHLLRLVGHHAALRSRFLRRLELEFPAAGAWQWECAITDDVPGSLHFQTHVVREGQEVDTVARISAETQQVLNISGGPLFAAAAFVLPDGALDLLMLAHHLVVDVVSWDILRSDLVVLLSGGLLPSATPPPFGSANKEVGNDSEDDPSCMQDAYKFWGIDETGRAGRAATRRPTKWTVSLTPSQTLALSASVRGIDSLDVGDAVEAAIGSAFSQMCQASGRTSSPRMVVEEHGRGSEQTTTVGWLTRLRQVSLSVSQSPVVEGIWRARHGRLNIADRNHAATIKTVPFEIVLNYVGDSSLNEAESGLLSRSPLSAAAERVADMDPSLESLALVEVVASLGEPGLALNVTCDGRLRNVDRVHAAIERSLRYLYMDIPAALASSEIRQSLRLLPVLDSDDYAVSERRRAQVNKLLGLDHIDQVQEVLACTPAQERILLAQARDPSHFHIHASWKVSALDVGGPLAPIDADKLQDACNEVVRHHASLRTRFVTLPDMVSPLQVVLANPPAGGPLRVRALSDGAAHIELQVSHAAFDGTSSATVERDIGLAYRGKPLDRKNTNTLRRYIQHVRQSNMEAADAFWAQYLAGAQPRCLPRMGLVPHKSEPEFGFFDSRLSAQFQGSLGPWCRRFKATAPAAIHVAWALTLRAYTGFEDVSFGWVAGGRDAPVTGIEDAVGMFGSLLVCRVTMGSGHRLTDVVTATVQDMFLALEHQIGSPRLNHQGQPLFDTILSVQTAASNPADEALKFQEQDGVDRTEYALVLNARVASETEFRLTYNSHKIPDSVAQAMLSAFEKAMGCVLAMTGDSGETVATTDLCSPLHCQLAQAFNSQSELFLNGYVGTQPAHTIPSLFSRQVEIRPDAVAVESWDARYTYAELDRASVGLARHLFHLGLRRGQIVPVLCDKSAAVIVSLLAILRVGASCAFLSPSDGTHRLRDIAVDQIGAQVVLASPNHTDKARVLGCDNVVVVDSKLVLEHDFAPNVRTHCSMDKSMPEDVAFVVFTSGSTGRPKGVMLPHSALCFSVLKYGPQLGISEHSRIFQFSAYTFDVGIGDMAASLIHGATLCVPHEHERTSDLNGAIERSKSNCLFITPSVAALLERERCSSLRILVLIGELPKAESYHTWRGRVRLFNAWGPAECAVLSTMHEIKSEIDPPSLIGRPANCRIWLVHPSDPSRLVPSGCIGEILVEGPNVAYGYLGDMKRATHAFLSPDQAPSALQPLPPGVRLYLTGDLARCVPQRQGLLFFEARKDLQVKLRGQRIELGEIESHFCQRAQEALRSLGLGFHRLLGAVDIFTQRTGDRALVAFLHVIPASETGRSGEGEQPVLCELSSFFGVQVDELGFYARLQEQLRQDLAAYMVPSAFLTLSALPRTTSGKLDRTALRALAQTHGVEHSSSTRTRSLARPATGNMVTCPRQQHLRTLWSKVLRLDECVIGLESNFFQLGGDSISAIRLAAAVRRTQGLSLSVLSIMNFPVFERMAAQMQQERDSVVEGGPSKPETTLVNGHVSVGCDKYQFPATNTQGAMVRFNMAPGRGFMNYFSLRLGPRTTKAAVDSACHAVLAHHAVLRSCFEQQGGSIIQRVLPEAGVAAIEHHRCTETDDLDVTAGLIIKSDRGAPLKWGDCLTRVFILRQDRTGASRVIFRLSHALYDGMCLPGLWQNFAKAYDGQSLGPEDALFRDFAKAAAVVSDDAVRFWTDLLRNSKITSVTTRSRSGFTDNLMTGRATRAIPSAHFSLFSVTPASVFKAAWAVVLAVLSNSDDIVFGHVVSGRETLAPSMLKSFGAFLNLIPVRACPESSQMSAAQLVHDIHSQHVATLPHNTVGLQQLVQLGCVDWPTDVRFSSVVQYQNLPSDSLVSLESGPLAAADIRVDGSTGAYADLWATATPVGESTNVEVVFDQLVVPPEVVNNLLDAVRMVLGSMHADNAATVATLCSVAKDCLTQS